MATNKRIVEIELEHSLSNPRTAVKITRQVQHEAGPEYEEHEYAPTFNHLFDLAEYIKDLIENGSGEIEIEAHARSLSVIFKQY